jgi:hypothetical protein
MIRVKVSDPHVPQTMYAPGLDERSVVSLFTGAGGLDLGLKSAGFEPVLCVELTTIRGPA